VWTFSKYNNAHKTEIINKEQKEIAKNRKSNKFQQESKLPTIEIIEFKKMLLKKDQPLIVDMRDANSYKSSHIINSIHASELDITRTGRNIILVNNNGETAGLSEIYQQLSNTNNQVQILKGGFQEWENSGGLTASFGDPESFVDQAKIKLIEPRDVNQISQDNPTEIAILDVRRIGNFNKGHAPKAINIPLSELEKRYKEIPNKRTIFVYGADELASFNAGVLLYNLGFFNVKTINGGFQAWQKYDYPIEEVIQE
jgi:rhodanese-related sulfurtransferase